MTDRTGHSEKRAIRNGAPPGCVSVREAARQINSTYHTLLRHCVPHDQWKAGRGDVPTVLIGRQRFVPQWWVDNVIAVARQRAEGF